MKNKEYDFNLLYNEMPNIQDEHIDLNEDTMQSTSKEDDWLWQMTEKEYEDYKVRKNQ